MNQKSVTPGRRWTRAWVTLVLLMLANSAYLVVVRRLPDPPRTEIAAGQTHDWPLAEHTMDDQHVQWWYVTRGDAS